MKELVLKKCMKCGALVEVLKDCTCDNCGIKCCGEEMARLMPNSTDASPERHVPQYEVKDNKIIITVDHPMDEEHHIEWVAIACDYKLCKKCLNPGEGTTVHFKYIPGSTIYAYCNKHGLWSNEVK